MKFNSLKAVGAVASVLASLACVPAQAAPQLIINDPGSPLAVFGGFDWASGSAGFTTGIQAAAANFIGGAGSTDFTFTYTAWANAITDPGGASLTTVGLDNNPDGVKGAGKNYEFTLKSTLNLKVTGLIPQGPGVFGVQFDVMNGLWDIKYDEAANALSQVGAWTGFNDGITVLSGNWGSSSGVVNGNGVSSSVDLFGGVTFTNSTYVTPDMIASILTTNLKLAPTVGINLPSSVDGTAIGVGEFVVKVDGDQYFVPEPMSLLLAGLGLAGQSDV